MIESEVKVFDSKINLHPIDAQNIDLGLNSPFESVELTSRFEEVRERDSVIFIRQRKLKRKKSSGIF
jgi:hypothetical protein